MERRGFLKGVSGLLLAVVSPKFLLTDQSNKADNRLKGMPLYKGMDALVVQKLSEEIENHYGPLVYASMRKQLEKRLSE